MTIESIETELLNELRAIDDYLNKDRVIYNEVRGALNIIQNKNKPYYHKIKHKLFMDFRMIDDHQIDDPQLDFHLDRAYKLAAILEHAVI
ncbi:hypothetical protein J4G66_20535 [Aeromonas dhakensis]|uniref:hypothetical protein n=1 Tax=Aeromonas dhakensis TaxID=196024 RepID=UPI001BD114C9|nr:hypothetical protein [Aeromonas dhakensis]MBS4718334.1 hypothetical protein [Aeromonas dhakensis]BEE00437.1 hypothetical protein VAWG001_20510 [Aeromonas dhakensis]